MRVQQTLGRRLRAEQLEDRRLLALTTVTTHLDVVNASDGVISLREAITATNASAGADEIQFDPSLSGKTIVLSAGQLKITDHLTITGPGASDLAISGNNQTRIFALGDYAPFPVGARKEVTISGLTIKHGRSEGGSGILSFENLTLIDSVVTSNVATQASTLGEFGRLGGGGAGIFAVSTVYLTTTIVRSEISDNLVTGAPEEMNLGASPTPGYNGGGIRAGGTLVISDSLISGNRAGAGAPAYHGAIGGNGGNGGGISFDGTLTIERTTITNNEAGKGANGGSGAWGFTPAAGHGGNGGGIDARGAVTIVDSVLSENSAGKPGTSPWNRSGNSGNGGGIALGPSHTSSTLTITNTSIVDNITPDGIIASPWVGTTGTHAGHGAGVYATGFVAITSSTIARNETGSGGGGVAYLGNSFAAGNAGKGAGLWLGGAEAKSIVNSTISSNATGNGGSDVAGGAAGNAGNGAGLWYEGTGALTIAHSTITANAAGERGVQSPSGLGGGLRGAGGGVYNNGASLSLKHSIVAGNSAGASGVEVTDLAGPGQFAADYSLIGSDEGATIIDNVGNQIGSLGAEIDPLLGPLANNGGLTETHALLVGSPALDAGEVTLVAGTGGTPSFDQRGVGYDRIVGAAIDLGSFEWAEPPLPPDADFDGSGVVDGNDFLYWQRGAGDADHDGDTDADDLQCWKDCYGQGSDPVAEGWLAPTAAASFRAELTPPIEVEQQSVAAEAASRADAFVETLIDGSLLAVAPSVRPAVQFFPVLRGEDPTGADRQQDRASRLLHKEEARRLAFTQLPSRWSALEAILSPTSSKADAIGSPSNTSADEAADPGEFAEQLAAAL